MEISREKKSRQCLFQATRKKGGQEWHALQTLTVSGQTNTISRWQGYQHVRLQQCH